MYGIINYDVFLVSAILLNLSPGTDTMYIVSRSISQGRAAGVYSALGISTGVIFHTLLAAFGLSILIVQSVVLFNIIKLIGAFYLTYLGIKMIMAKRIEKENHSSLPKQTNQKIFLQGMITNITNPKVALFFLALLPQFIDSDAVGSSPIPFIF